MTSGELAIVIAGTHEDWSGGARTLTRARVHPNGTLSFGADGTLSFGAELDPDGDHVWFRTEENAVGRMLAATPADRGRTPGVVKMGPLAGDLLVEDGPEGVRLDSTLRGPYRALLGVLEGVQGFRVRGRSARSRSRCRSSARNIASDRVCRRCWWTPTSRRSTSTRPFPIPRVVSRDDLGMYDYPQ